MFVIARNFCLRPCLVMELVTDEVLIPSSLHQKCHNFKARSVSYTIKYLFKLCIFILFSLCPALLPTVFPAFCPLPSLPLLGNFMLLGCLTSEVVVAYAVPDAQAFSRQSWKASRISSDRVRLMSPAWYLYILPCIFTCFQGS